MENIFPTYDTLLKQEDQERLLQQRAHTFWLTGLSGSGKTTLARKVERMLFERWKLVKVLDGDNVRMGLCAGLGFQPEDRLENIRRVAEASKLFVDTGVITINSFVSPLQNMRELARNIIGSEHFHEIYISAPLETCEARDVKGLYKKARAGEIPTFTGVNTPFEAPENPALELDTSSLSIDAAANQLLEYILNTTKF